MRKVGLIVFLLQLSALCLAQNLDSAIFSDVDHTDWKRRFYSSEDSLSFIKDSIEAHRRQELEQYVLSMKKNYATITALSADLVKPAKNEEEKVWLIFRWVTDNISYDCQRYHGNPSGVSYSYDPKVSKAVIEAKIENLAYEDGLTAFRKRKGICEDYADLFKALCDINNITCRKVHGYADKYGKAINKNQNNKALTENHAWNTVLLDGKWYMLDATWSSGYCDEKVTKFTKRFTLDYYLSPLAEGYPDHLLSKALIQSFQEN